MNDKNYWNQFLNSGKVEDYLKYKGLDLSSEKQVNNNEPNFYNWIDNKRTESR